MKRNIIISRGKAWSGILLVVAVSCVAVFVGWKRIVRSEPPMCKECNVILISMDTLSAEHLPCYGYGRNTAPGLCAFGEKNILFRHAYGNATYTLPTHVSVFTGWYPSAHGIELPGIGHLADNVPFLPSILQKNGYTTIFYLPFHNEHMPMDRVYNRGIDVTVDENESTWAQALQSFEERVAAGQKTFLFLHSYFIHPPYPEMEGPKLYTKDSIDWMTLRESDIRDVSPVFIEYVMVALGNDVQNRVHTSNEFMYVRLLADLDGERGSYERQKQLLLQAPEILEEYRKKYDPLLRLDPNNERELSYFRALYDQRIHEFDSGAFQELLRVIEKPSIKNNTVVLITSDHGEDFGEHGQLHHTSLYSPNTHILFMMALPGGVRRTISEYVQSVDITPTILDILGITGEYRFQGMSVRPVIGGGSLPEHLLVAESGSKKTFRLGRWKLFSDIRSGSPVPIELYDTEIDPGERRNVLFPHMEIARDLLTRYRDFEAGWARINR